MHHCLGLAARLGDQRQRALSDGQRARPLRAGVTDVFFGADRAVDCQQLHAHRQRPRFVVQHPRQHVQRGRTDGPMAVAGPRVLAARAADQHISAAAVGFGQQRQQIARSGQVRKHVLAELALQERRGVIEQAATLHAAADAGDHTAQRSAKLAQGRSQTHAVLVAGDRRSQHGQLGVGMTRLQPLQLGRVAGDRDHRPAGIDGRLHDAATDTAGGTEDDEGGFHCPAPGIFTPARGTVSESVTCLSMPLSDRQHAAWRSAAR